jgi:hypothetical protein
MPHSFSKTSALLLLFSIAVQLAFAQTLSSSISKDEFLFKKGSLLQELAVEGLGLNETIRDKQDQSRSAYAAEIKESILDEALKYYQELADSFPRSPFFNKALINQARIKLELEDTVEAEKSLQLVLGPKVSDKEKKKIPQEPVIDPNSIYKNEAARIMAEIALANREYQRALGFLEERKKYPRTGTYCGFDSDAARTTQLYAKCYMGLKKYLKVSEVLLPNLFSDEMDSVGEELLYEALLKTNKKEDLIKKYELAFKNFAADKSKGTYFIVFLNRQIDILPLLKPALLIQDAAYPGNEMDKIYKDTWLYERLRSTEENKKP